MKDIDFLQFQISAMTFPYEKGEKLIFLLFFDHFWDLVRYSHDISMNVYQLLNLVPGKGLNFNMQLKIIQFFFIFV